MNNLIVKLYRVSKTILTTKDLALIWGEKNLNEKIFYYGYRLNCSGIWCLVFSKK